MHLINAKNVNDALFRGIELLKSVGKPVAPRGMPTLEVEGPVTTRYQNPWQCVLFDVDRDANPFFHLYEALWILAGRNDVAPIVLFNKNMAQFSNDGKTFQGAYGHRLRRHFGLDQLKRVAEILTKDPDSRRAVAAIYDPRVDVYGGKDVPCNDFIAFTVRRNVLSTTVFCRSNDIIWGCYGANAVQFAFVHEWMRSALDCLSGEYRQISNSFHVYTTNSQGPRQAEMWETLSCKVPGMNPYDDPLFNVISYPLCSDTADFVALEKDLLPFTSDPLNYEPENWFLRHVARPMFNLWHHHQNFHKNDRKPSIRAWQEESSPYLRIDWLRAGYEWVDRRERKYMI